MNKLKDKLTIKFNYFLMNIFLYGALALPCSLAQGQIFNSSRELQEFLHKIMSSLIFTSPFIDSDNLRSNSYNKSLPPSQSTLESLSLFIQTILLEDQSPYENAPSQKREELCNANSVEGLKDLLDKGALFFIFSDLANQNEIAAFLAIFVDQETQTIAIKRFQIGRMYRNLGFGSNMLRGLKLTSHFGNLSISIATSAFSGGFFFKHLTPIEMQRKLEHTMDMGELFNTLDSIHSVLIAIDPKNESLSIRPNIHGHTGHELPKDLIHLEQSGQRST